MDHHAADHAANCAGASCPKPPPERGCSHFCRRNHSSEPQGLRVLWVGLIPSSGQMNFTQGPQSQSSCRRSWVGASQMDAQPSPEPHAAWTSTPGGCPWTFISILEPQSPSSPTPQPDLFAGLSLVGFLRLHRSLAQRSEHEVCPRGACPSPSKVYADPCRWSLGFHRESESSFPAGTESYPPLHSWDLIPSC